MLPADNDARDGKGKAREDTASQRAARRQPSEQAMSATAPERLFYSTVEDEQDEDIDHEPRTYQAHRRNLLERSAMGISHFASLIRLPSGVDSHGEEDEREDEYGGLGRPSGSSVLSSAALEQKNRLERQDNLDPFRRSQAELIAQTLSPTTDSSIMSHHAAPRDGWRVHRSSALPSTTSGGLSASSSRASSPPVRKADDSPERATSLFLPHASVASSPPRRFDYARKGVSDDVPATNRLYVYPSNAGNRIRLEADVPRIYYRDAAWLAAYLASLSTVVLYGFYQSFIGTPLLPPESDMPSETDRPTETIASSIPLLIILTLLSLLSGVAATASLAFYKRGAYFVVHAAVVSVPLLLVLAGAWSYAGSYVLVSHDNEEHEGHWLILARTLLRAFSVLVICAAGWLAQTAYKNRKRLQQTVHVLELAATIISDHQALLVLCLGFTVAFTVITFPFLSIFSTAVSHGVYTGTDKEHERTWHVDSTSGTFACFVVFTWLWTLGVMRGIQRMTVSGVVGAWWFSRHDPDSPTSNELIVASLQRATGPSLGTVCYSALLLALLDSLALVSSKMRNVTRSTSRLPGFLSPLYYLAPAFALAASFFDAISSYALVFAGLTGQPFAESARRSAALISSNRTGYLLDNLLVKYVLNMISLALATLAGLAGFMFATYTVSEAHYAPLISLLCAIVPFWTVRLCSDVLSNAVDGIFLCYNLDVASGSTHCSKAVEVFAESVLPL
ncbi:uncharacterized protein L969DRAFT_101482 [Mixia osmundae IAM 14324]|uniref:Protein PNS1 n=1 Tax=Mixia osmundae (strain CBS 9802 / IAM 14324 / JCM 22182 / KY 12970) TaxID=764103 RepID=G7DXD9_MIXOS|nr:uncharacterized protein L969DRAFT_101482 [Mixia osmundae IAM 14324]KEI41257.1 hypothetical protein L969DRAFT_101482 [Mixia osmundae IAM 14324]GAA95249.1 hypothetical protein E5Q_01905 [Mixia osmundae IAM 14324]